MPILYRGWCGRPQVSGPQSEQEPEGPVACRQRLASLHQVISGQWSHHLCSASTPSHCQPFSLPTELRIAMIIWILRTHLVQQAQLAASRSDQHRDSVHWHVRTAQATLCGQDGQERSQTLMQWCHLQCSVEQIWLCAHWNLRDIVQGKVQELQLLFGLE